MKRHPYEVTAARIRKHLADDAYDDLTRGEQILLENAAVILESFVKPRGIVDVELPA